MGKIQTFGSIGLLTKISCLMVYSWWAVVSIQVSQTKCVSIILPNIAVSFNRLFWCFRDPFSAHRQQMRAMFGPFGMDPFAVTPHIQPHRAPRRQVISGTSATLRLWCKKPHSIKWRICNNTDFEWPLLGWSSGSLWHDGDGEQLHHLVSLFWRFCDITDAFLSKIKHVLLPLNQAWRSFYMHGCLKFHCGFTSAGRRVHGHVWNDGGNDGKRGERRAVSHYQSFLNFPNKTRLGTADPCLTIVCLCCLCLQERMTGAPNCQTFSSSTVISYSSSGAGAPKVYQQTSQTTTGPGGVRISNHAAFTILRFLLFF